MSSDHTPAAKLGQLAVLHAGCLILFLSWRFGGMEPLTRTLATWACLPAPILTVLALRACSSGERRAAIWILVPLLALTLQVGVSLFNPNRQFFYFWETPMLRAIEHLKWAPTTALPSATIADFTLNAGLVCCGLNLMLAHPTRGWLRGLLWMITINGAILAGVGTLYHLVKATGILGRIPSPNPSFFATFVYHNHWGAFALLSAGAALGLALYLESRSNSKPLTQTAVPFLALIGAVIIVTIPVSTARASTAAAAMLVLGFAFLFGRRLLKRFSKSGRSSGIRRTGLAVAALGVIAFGALLGREAWTKELAQTREQFADLQAGGSGDARLIIYKDTLKLIESKPLFGWGWQSFQYVYPDVQSEIPRMQSRIGRYAVLDAHNDWLQLLAETGIFGTGCLLLTALGCLRWGGISHWKNSPQVMLFLALVSLALLAVIDFPLACPAVVITAACLLGAGAELARTTHRGLHSPKPE